MINSEFIFITFTLFSLILAAIWMKIPKATIPLGLIYIIFIFINLNSSDKTDQLSNILNFQDSSRLVEKENLSEAIDVSNTLVIEPFKPSLEPKPLTFDSEIIKVKKKKTLKRPTEKEKAKLFLEDPDIQKKNMELSVKDIKICKNIYKRTPVGSDVIFTNTVDSLYCFSRIQNPGAKTEVKHVWYYENKVMTQVRYNVKKSNIYRSWTKKTILSSQVGKWRVDIQDSNGTIIGSKKFKIVKAKKFN